MKSYTGKSIAMPAAPSEKQEKDEDRLIRQISSAPKQKIKEILERISQAEREKIVGKILAMKKENEIEPNNGDFAGQYARNKKIDAWNNALDEVIKKL